MFKNTSLTRWFFLVVSLLIITLIMWNTYSFFNQLKENEREKMDIWGAAQKNIENEDDSNDLILKILQGNMTTPMILYSHKQESYNNKNIPEEDFDTPEKIQNLITQFSNEYEPIEIRYKDELLQTIYFGNSPIINKIKFYPAALILIMLLFFSAIYFFFKTAKASEQNKLWAGMAKETAHQIGTPLSSLYGWTEILKSENVNPEYIVEIEKDVDRLQTITERFSKVGSIPLMEKNDIVLETKKAYDYLKSRTSKLIEFELELPEDPLYVKMNPQLFGWTFENLVKNGIDAMRGKGKITITIETNLKSVFIRISDTGKGIQKKNFNKIFVPGFTTKKRGWGLGLSLAKRIIEDYHKGKIRVSKSVIDKGTTIEISLKQITD
ncbi:MAG: two-component system, sporulation sensor kinase D [Flavobacteriaceae bacterium]|jgi:two-component system, sporulation sensor kinase D